MTVILTAIGDLMFQSKVDVTAQQVGALVRKASRGHALVDEIKRTGAQLVLLDLASPAFGGADAVRTVRADPTVKDVRIIGYCRHTATDLIAEAERAGCSQVLTQGEFSSKLPAILKG